MKRFGDWAIALTVIACSAVLFFALVFALQGNPFANPSRTLRAQFPDITGIQSSSLVKYAGAVAGSVHAVRMLTPEERAASSNPANAIEIIIALNPNVPALSDGLVASVAADTLLSDKFVLLSGGNPKGAPLANGAVIASIAPVTFDAILRDLSGMLAKMRQIFGSLDASGGGGLDGILPKVDALLAQLNQTVVQANGLITNGNGLITHANGLVDNGDGLIVNANGLIADGRTLLSTNKEPINRLIAQLATAADSLDQLARRADKLVKDNEKNITATAGDAKAALSELKATAISAHALVDSLRARPQQLLWGPGRPPKAPQ
jgi:ABC-type transporter Mla subunit MlaD